MQQDRPQYDVVIIGAGISGIGAAYYLKTYCPWAKWVVLEGRESIGGTWDLFRYPGIRSDSDMYTFGFSFYPWKNPQSIADGPAILQYVNETADHFGLRPHIRFNCRAEKADWQPASGKWLLHLHTADGSETIMDTRFLFMCTGYYNYAQGYLPDFPGADRFSGTLIHPQHWDPTLDYAGKKVVIIGSGATAVTLLPEMAKKAALVTMLQRTPTYIMNLPRKDVIANTLKKILPPSWAHGISRWKNILIGLAFYKACRKWPAALKGFLKKQVHKALGDLYEEKHFDPYYNPWDQRLCFVPDNDLFEAIKKGNAQIVTDTIGQITPTGISLQSGKHLDADIIVAATGLRMQLFGGMQVLLNGAQVDFSKIHAYKGVMLSGIPNFGIAVGYTNASWTLKAELNCRFVSRLLNHMHEMRKTQVTAQYEENGPSEPLLDFNSGYIKRAEHFLPRQGNKAPWKVYQNYIRDVFSLKHANMRDRYLHFEG